MNGRKLLPPLVSGNRLKLLKDQRDTLKEDNLSIGGYIRISTNKDSQITSIENQKKYIAEWANINGYNILKFYIDVKSGAYTYLRNDMLQMREDIKKGIIKGIVSKEISRTSRDIMDILELKRGLADNGAFFISIKESYDSRTDDDEFLLVIHAGLAQKERKTTSSRVKITQLIKAREGKTNVPHPAYGYRLTEDRQHIEIDPDKAKIYRFIVEKYLEGWGQLKIIKYLNSNGILSKRGSTWGTNSIRTIITNPVYLGMTIYNVTTLVRDSSGKAKRVVRPEEEWIIRHNTHEPLISEEEFERIQVLVEKKKAADKKEWSSTRIYLLSGLLYCNVCKGKIYGSKSPSHSKKHNVEEKKYFYTYCDQNRFGICDTKSKYWNMERIDNAVLNEIKSFFTDKSMIEQRIRSKQYLFNKNLTDEKKERERLQIKLEQLSNAIRKQQTAYENEVISLDEYKSRFGELRAEKTEISEKVELLNRKLERVDNVEDRFYQIKNKVISIIDNIDKLDYNLKEALIRKIVRKIYL
ncbi:MAG: recombinase family protein, partial [Clostridiaceae bacterium]|nr:recombinase family protein [Clostridiaceae bacterium]